MSPPTRSSLATGGTVTSAHEQLNVSVPSISSRELEAGLDNFLNSFVEDGRASNQGVILIKSVPSSKVRKSAAQSFSSRSPIPLTTYNTALQGNGSFILAPDHTDSTINWVEKAESLGGGAKAAENFHFEDILRGLGTFGTQCQEIKSSFQGLRQALQVHTFPVSAPDTRFRSLCADAGITHLYGSIINISTLGSPLPIRTSLACLTAMFFHHRGSPRHWIVVPPKEKAKFENRIRQEFQMKPGDSCSQFVHHLSIWLTPEVLRRWGVEFIEVTQDVHELMFIFPHAYFWGYSCGFSIIECKSHAGRLWDYYKYKFCSEKSSRCLAVGFPLVVFPVGDMRTPDSATDADHRKSKRRKIIGHREQPELSRPERDLESAVSRQDEICSANEGLVEPPSTSRMHQNKDLSFSVTNTDPDKVNRRVLGGHKGHTIGSSASISTSSNKNGLQESQVESPVVQDNQLSGTQREIFDISDDEEAPTLTVSRNDDRVERLQMENSALLRDLDLARREKEQINARKSVYKSRLMERENYISLIESQLKEAKVDMWKEVLKLAEERIAITRSELK